jgi:hypothetical protein
MSAAAVAAEPHSERTKRKGSVYDPAIKHRNAPQEIESAGQPVVLLRSEQLRVNRAVLALAGIGLGAFEPAEPPVEALKATGSSARAALAAFRERDTAR